MTAQGSIPGDLVSLEGKFERPVTEPKIEVPFGLELDEANDRLTYMLGTAGRIRPGPGLLEEFVRLEGQPCQSFYKYARRRGVLGICKHDLPSTHSPRARISVSFPRSPFGCSPRPVSRSAGQSTSVKDLEFWVVSQFD